MLPLFILLQYNRNLEGLIFFTAVIRVQRNSCKIKYIHHALQTTKKNWCRSVKPSAKHHLLAVLKQFMNAKLRMTPMMHDERHLHYNFRHQYKKSKDAFLYILILYGIGQKLIPVTRWFDFIRESNDLQLKSRFVFFL